MPDQFASRKGGTDAAVSAPSNPLTATSPPTHAFFAMSPAPRALLFRHMIPALAPFGLTGHQFNLMMTLGTMGPMAVGALADVLGMDASGVPRAIRPLADGGLIGVERGVDRRQRVLSLTEEGPQAARQGDAGVVARSDRTGGRNRRGPLDVADDRVARCAQCGGDVFDSPAGRRRRKLTFTLR
jgi:DNA-binding MarR family transcriptional regulator